MYIEKLGVFYDSFSSPESCAQAGYHVSGHRIWADEPITVELKGCVYSTVQRLIVFGYEIWVNDKPLYRDTLNCGYSSVGYIGEDGGPDYCEKTDKECENVLKEILDKPWKPIFTRINDDLILISTPEKTYARFVVPSIVINTLSRKGTVIDDIQEYELLKKYKLDITEEKSVELSTNPDKECVTHRDDYTGKDVRVRD